MADIAKLDTEQQRTWGIPQSGQPKDIINRKTWTEQGFKVSAVLKANTNGHFYLTVIAPNGQRGGAYFSKAIQSLLEEAALKVGDKVSNLADVIAIHVSKNEQGVVTDLFIGAMSKDDDWL
jgi:hypothetical protein